MIEAWKGFGTAVFFPANLRTAMRAGVKHRLESALGIAGEQNAPTADLAGDKIAGLCELGTMAEIEPAFIEYLRSLGLENIGVDKSAA
jgi:hypothetical protein